MEDAKEILIEGFTSLIKVWIKKYKTVTDPNQFPNLEKFRNDYPQFSYDTYTCLLLENLIGIEFCNLKLGRS
jgi:hypothetical protein